MEIHEIGAVAMMGDPERARMSENATGVGHIRSLAFLTPGNFADDDPYTGVEATLQLFEDAVIRSPGNVQRPRLQPRAEGLVERIWYGAGSAAKWAGEQGLNLLSGNVIFGNGADLRAGPGPGRTSC
jgi:hypothetical protein